MKRKAILILLTCVMLSFLLPPNAAAADGLVVGSTVELSYEEKYIGTDGKTYKGGDIRTLHVGTFMSVCVEPNVKITNGSYTVSNAQADPVILRAIYYFEQIKNNTNYPDVYAALQYAIWDPYGSWAPTDEYGGVVGRPAEAAYHYILQGLRSGTPSADELNTIYDGQYCMLDSPVGSQRQLCWARGINIPEQKGSISIEKFDEEGNWLENAEFTVYDSMGNYADFDGNVGKGIMSTAWDGSATTGTDALDFGTYTVVETKCPEGYTATEADAEASGAQLDVNGQLYWTVTIDDTHRNISIVSYNSVELIDIPVKKIWDDESDKDGIRPDSVTIRLYDDEDVNIDEVTITGTGDEWTYTFTDLPSIREGTLVTYYIEEVTPSGYSSTVTGSYETGFTITNKHVPNKRTEVTVTKQWKDSNNTWGLRPDSVTIRLLANGTEVAHAVVSGSATADSWTYTFTDLPIEDGGAAITYTVTEDPVRNYSTEIDGFTVTNEFVPIVPTGIEVDIAPYAALMFVGAFGSAALMRKKDR